MQRIQTVLTPEHVQGFRTLIKRLQESQYEVEVFNQDIGTTLKKYVVYAETKKSNIPQYSLDELIVLFNDMLDHKVFPHEYLLYYLMRTFNHSLGDYSDIRELTYNIYMLAIDRELFAFPGLYTSMLYVVHHREDLLDKLDDGDFAFALEVYKTAKANKQLSYSLCVNMLNIIRNCKQSILDAEFSLACEIFNDAETFDKTGIDTQFDYSRIYTLILQIAKLSNPVNIKNVLTYKNIDLAKIQSIKHIYRMAQQENLNDSIIQRLYVDALLLAGDFEAAKIAYKDAGFSRPYTVRRDEPSCYKFDLHKTFKFDVKLEEGESIGTAFVGLWFALRNLASKRSSETQMRTVIVYGAGNHAAPFQDQENRDLKQATNAIVKMMRQDLMIKPNSEKAQNNHACIQFTLVPKPVQSLHLFVPRPTVGVVIEEPVHIPATRPIPIRQQPRDSGSQQKGAEKNVLPRVTG